MTLCWSSVKLGLHQGTSVGVTSRYSAIAEGLLPDFEPPPPPPPTAIFPVRRSFRYIRHISELCKVAPLHDKATRVKNLIGFGINARGGGEVGCDRQHFWGVPNQPTVCGVILYGTRTKYILAYHGTTTIPVLVQLIPLVSQ